MQIYMMNISRESISLLIMMHKLEIRPITPSCIRCCPETWLYMDVLWFKVSNTISEDSIHDIHMTVPCWRRAHKGNSQFSDVGAAPPNGRNVLWIRCVYISTVRAFALQMRCPKYIQCLLTALAGAAFFMWGCFMALNYNGLRLTFFTF